MIKFSIITPSYNSAATIADAIHSVVAQGWPHVEHIIVDGNSTDGTERIVREHASVARFIREKDDGPYDAMNKGIRAAHGDVVGILNADDRYTDGNVLSSVAEAMEASGADVAWGDLWYVDRNDTAKKVRVWRSSPYAPGIFKKGWMPPHPTFFVRREVYEKFGAFDTSFRIAADYELMLRLLAREGVRGVYIPKVLVKMRTGGLSNRSVKNIVAANLESYRAWKKNGLRGGLCAVIRKPLSKVGQWLN